MRFGRGKVWQLFVWGGVEKDLRMVLELSGLCMIWVGVVNDLGRAWEGFVGECVWNGFGIVWELFGKRVGCVCLVRVWECILKGL